MPQVTVYIREGDLPKWKSIKKKTEFLHNALNRTVTGDLKIQVAKVDKRLKLREPVPEIPGVKPAVEYNKTNNWGA